MRCFNPEVTLNHNALGNRPWVQNAAKAREKNVPVTPAFGFLQWLFQPALTSCCDKGKIKTGLKLELKRLHGDWCLYFRVNLMESQGEKKTALYHWNTLQSHIHKIKYLSSILNTGSENTESRNGIFHCPRGTALNTHSCELGHV